VPVADNDVAAIKRQLRSRVWQALRDNKLARFPGARGRIPNFVGAEAAAKHLQRTRVWRDAQTIKCNPDSPQRPIRRTALDAGKLVYMPVPRLRSDEAFYELDPAVLDETQYWHASSIKGAAELGRPIGVTQVAAIDLIVTGCVAVTRAGGRLGKGGGYSDLEYAVLRELGLVAEDTPIATTVHSLQLVRKTELPMTAHDISIDVIATETKVIRTRNRPPRPEGVLWDHLDDEKIDAIPILRARRPR